MAVKDIWPNLDQHVQGSTEVDGSDFTNSAHTLIYAKLNSAVDGTYHALGVIQGWSFTEQKQVEEVFELGSDIRYIVPGRTTGQLAITRMLINGADVLNTLYGNTATASDTKLNSLKDINEPIDIMFASYHNSAPNAIHMVRNFINCWIVARQESITANQVVIAENCTISYEKMA